MDYYTILGVDKNADQLQIKKAYRSLVKQHHPDQGGDPETFKKINEAYEVLGDPVKKQQYDNPQPEIQFNANNFEDLFGSIFGRHVRQTVRNRDLKISITLSLEEVLNGKEVVATYSLSNGEQTSANIKIHPGVVDSEAIRFRGLGDNYFSNQPRGDLIVYVRVLRHKDFERDGKNLKKTVYINVFDLILGKKITVKTLQGGEITVNVPAGTNPGTILSVAGYGLPDLRTNRQGNLYLVLKAETPKITNSDLLERIKKINDEINSST
jgi:curved DNA-binding protein